MLSIIIAFPCWNQFISLRSVRHLSLSLVFSLGFSLAEFRTERTARIKGPGCNSIAGETVSAPPVGPQWRRCRGDILRRWSAGERKHCFVRLLGNEGLRGLLAMPQVYCATGSRSEPACLLLGPSTLADQKAPRHGWRGMFLPRMACSLGIHSHTPQQSTEFVRL